LRSSEATRIRNISRSADYFASICGFVQVWPSTQFRARANRACSLLDETAPAYLIFVRHNL
jgi:hypothetical protein